MVSGKLPQRWRSHPLITSPGMRCSCAGTDGKACNMTKHNTERSEVHDTMCECAAGLFPPARRAAMAPPTEGERRERGEGGKSRAEVTVQQRKSSTTGSNEDTKHTCANHNLQPSLEKNQESQKGKSATHPIRGRLGDRLGSIAENPACPFHWTHPSCCASLRVHPRVKTPPLCSQQGAMLRCCCCYCCGGDCNGQGR